MIPTITSTFRRSVLNNQVLTKSIRSISTSQVLRQVESQSKPAIQGLKGDGDRGE